VIARIARDVPEIGFLTTKTISVDPREGYREPIIHEYYPGCFVNAVGLANPGAKAFAAAMKPLLPLHQDKPLLVSIMGKDPDDFLQCALILDPVADAFELNLSCPHVKGAGQSVGSDPETVRAIISLLKSRIEKPLIPKLSPNLGDIPGMAKLCEEAGADGLCLINTVGPGTAVDYEGNPVLSNVAGGLSGAGILPVGLKAVREAAGAVNLPIIAAGGITTAGDVRAYQKAGASLFSVGSALAGMTTTEIADFFAGLAASLKEPQLEPADKPCVFSATRTSYRKTRVLQNTSIGPGLFKLRLEAGPLCDPGRFFFLRLPGVGEKPFSPAGDVEPVYLARSVGPFTRALEALKPGDSIYIRGPYGKGFPEPDPLSRLVLIGGGTGAAPVIMAAARWSGSVVKAFFGFSSPVAEWFRDELQALIPDTHLLVDPPDRPGEVVRAVAADVSKDLGTYKNSRIYVCGPAPMMKAVVQLMAHYVPGERMFLAREDLMRCGIGVCGSCGTKTGLRSCIDGPVMNPDQ